MSCSAAAPPSADGLHDSSSISVVVLTPPGRGAVATVLVSGGGAMAAVGHLFSPASGNHSAAVAAGQIQFGRWGGPAGEELVVCRRSERQIEIHCHGGQAAVSAVVASLAELGASEVPWKEWSRRQTDDVIAAEALVSLSQATTLRCANVLLDQYHGALRLELDRCAALTEAPDEASPRAANDRLEALRQRWRVGRHLVEPFRVVVCGKPNVGKSSLINALVGYQRSIVYDQPGTTRDAIRVRTAIDGWPVELCDTAGLRSSGDPLEAAGVRLAVERFSDADLRVLVFDATQTWDDEDRSLAARWPDALIVYNKSDLAAPVATPPGAITTSALLGSGIDDLIGLLGRRLVPVVPPPSAAVPFTAWQERIIREAIELLSSGKRRAAALRLRGEESKADEE
jgi:tRNA modification GTPase